jgi:hypothetical protein
MLERKMVEKENGRKMTEEDVDVEKGGAGKRRSRKKAEQEKGGAGKRRSRKKAEQEKGGAGKRRSRKTRKGGATVKTALIRLH